MQTRSWQVNSTWVSALGVDGSGMSEFCESRDDSQAIATFLPATFLILRMPVRSATTRSFSVAWSRYLRENMGAREVFLTASGVDVFEQAVGPLLRPAIRPQRCESLAAEPRKGRISPAIPEALAPQRLMP